MRLIPDPLNPGFFLGFDTNEYLNLIRNPDRPFDASSAIFIDNITRFENDGTGVRWIPFDLPLYADAISGAPSTGVQLLQVASMTDIARGRDLQRQLREAGFDAYWESVKTAKGDDVVRVRVSVDRATQSVADTIAKLKAMGLDPIIVNP